MMLERFSDGGHFEALELFCGMGGLSSGFVQNGFKVTGVDISEKAGQTFSSNRLGTFVKKDLMRTGVHGKFDVVIGGPPCEPWSCLNLTRRGNKHPLYGCLGAFFRIDLSIPPLYLLRALQREPEKRTILFYLATRLVTLFIAYAATHLGS